jgi:colicin import membrane protein
MAEQKESSVLFSLKELMNLEEDRIKQEDAERRRQEEAAVQARLDAEKRVRDQEEARLRAEEEAKRSAEQRSREEQARLEAIRQAEIERTRLEAENAARIEQLRQQQDHEHRIAALSQDKGKKKLLYAAIGAGVFLLITIVVAGFAIKSSMERQEALEAQLKSLNSESDELKTKLASAASPEEREALKKQIEENEKAMQALKDHPDKPPPTPAVRKPSGPKPAGNTGTGDKPKAPCNCTPGDPLCSCL